MKKAQKFIIITTMRQLR